MSAPKTAKLDDLSQAKRVLEVEAQCILNARDRLDERFERAVVLMENAVKQGGKVVVSGVGKSGKIAAKVAATLSSLGTPALFLHPTEASHGDLGIVSNKDVMLVFSYSGTSDEVVRLLPSLHGKGTKIISVVGNMNSALAKKSDIVLDGSVEQEACPMNLAPTSSTTVALALGDALAIALSLHFDFKEEHFAINHPAGALGKRLTLTVRDLMKTGNALAWVDEATTMDLVVNVSTEKALGAALVYNEEKQFSGLITDGDIRRALKHKKRFFELKATEVMTRSPISINPEDKAIHALELMQNRPSQINVLPVIDERGQCVGLVRLHDLIGQL